MSATYTAVVWNRNIRIYDLVLLVVIVAYLSIFCLVGAWFWSGSNEVLLLRALGTCGFGLLTGTLCIGPLARLDRRWLPVLYNRRHLGVATFVVGLSHAALATIYYHGFGNVNPLVSLLGTNTQYASLTSFPFEIFGVVAFIILLFMAATSHDFWQKNLEPSVWKSLHMLVYLAYVSLVLHVAFGILHTEPNPVYFALLTLSVAATAGLHIATAIRELRKDREATGSTPLFQRPKELDWHDVCAVNEIPENRARVVTIAHGERIAIFRYGNKISAVTNVCAHQRGPLGEGRIIYGCVTCPWHGWSYQPHNGQSPPPFQERISTYSVRVEQGRVFVCPNALPPGTPVPPAMIESDDE